MATNWKIVDGNLPYEDSFFAPIPNTSMSDTDAPYFFYRIIDGDLPFRNTFHSIPDVSGFHNLQWCLIPDSSDESKSLVPFKTIFNPIVPIDTIPSFVWRINPEEDDSPWKIPFNPLLEIDDVSNIVWMMDEDKDDSPWKKAFNPLLKINDAPNMVWIINPDKDDSPWKKAFLPLYKPVKEAPPKYVKIKAIMIKDLCYEVIVNNPITYNVKVRKGVR